jgi:hypothetical protein
MTLKTALQLHGMGSLFLLNFLFPCRSIRSEMRGFDFDYKSKTALHGIGWCACASGAFLSCYADFTTALNALHWLFTSSRELMMHDA